VGGRKGVKEGQRDAGKEREREGEREERKDVEGGGVGWEGEEGE